MTIDYNAEFERQLPLVFCEHRFPVSQDLQWHSLAGFSNISPEAWRKADLGAIKLKILLEVKAANVV